MVLFLMTSSDLGLTYPLPVILTNAFMVHCLILGHSADIISAKAAKQNVSGVLSKLRKGCQCCYFISPVLTPCFLAGDPGPDTLTPDNCKWWFSILIVLRWLARIPLSLFTNV